MEALEAGSPGCGRTKPTDVSVSLVTQHLSDQGATNAIALGYLLIGDSRRCELAHLADLFIVELPHTLARGDDAAVPFVEVRLPGSDLAREVSGVDPGEKAHSASVAAFEPPDRGSGVVLLSQRLVKDGAPERAPPSRLTIQIVRLALEVANASLEIARLRIARGHGSIPNTNRRAPRPFLRSPYQKK